ncbi:hypothetical protein OROMI_034068 [Orobanche minor]
MHSISLMGPSRDSRRCKTPSMGWGCYRKLAPKWKRSYLIDSEAGKGAYWLAKMDGEILPSWDAVHLKAYHM